MNVSHDLPISLTYQRAGASERVLRPAFLLVTVAIFFAFVSIGVVLPVLPRCTESPLGAGSVAVGIAVGAASMTALLAQPSAGRLRAAGTGAATPSKRPRFATAPASKRRPTIRSRRTRASGQLRRWGSFPGTREVLVYPFRAREAGRVDDLDDARPALGGLSWELPDGLEPATPPYQGVVRCGHVTVLTTSLTARPGTCGSVQERRVTNRESCGFATMELAGLEPATSWVRSARSPSVRHRWGVAA